MVETVPLSNFRNKIDGNDPDDLRGDRQIGIYCNDLKDRCLYTSVSLFVWLRLLRYLRICFIVVPIVCGAVASWDLLGGSGDGPRVFVATLALVAGLVPSIYAALKLDEHLPTAARLAGEYKNLEIRLMKLQILERFQTAEKFEQEYEAIQDRLEKANAEAYTAPEFCFKIARKKIISGHYHDNSSDV